MGGIAFTSTLVYAVIFIMNRFYAHAFTNRPIVVCPILGAFLGDAATGLQLGAALEMLFIGITTIGGSLPADVFLAGTLVTAFVVGTGISMEAGIVLAVAIGVVAAMFTLFNRIIGAGAFAVLFDKWAAEGKWKTYRNMGYIGQLILVIVPTVTVYAAIYFGAEAVQNLMESIPAGVQAGMGVAKGMMPAVGIALLMNMLWSWKASIYFFFGFGITVYLGINMTAMIIVAAFITIVQIYNEMKVRDAVKAVAGTGLEGKGDDLFG